ncbi:MAG TPA: hypothetical protein VH814_17870 [Steroidobacteraceae bacterium]|jgi:hypothetical protein
MRASLLCALVALAPLAASAAEPLGRHRPSLESIEVLQKSSVPPLATGEFTVASGAAIDDTNGVSFRMHKRVPARGESLASYARAAFVTELRAAGKHDPAAKAVITGMLVESRLDEGSAALAVRIQVSRSGQPVYDKVLRVESNWDSALLGEVAIPDAFNHYTELYGKLILQLFQDQAFIVATAR